MQNGVFVYVTLAQEGEAEMRYLLVPKERMGIFEDYLGNNSSEFKNNFFEVFNLAVTHNLRCQNNQPSVSYLWNYDDWSLQKLN